EWTQDYGQNLNFIRTVADQLAAMRAMILVKAREPGSSASIGLCMAAAVFLRDSLKTKSPIPEFMAPNHSPSGRQTCIARVLKIEGVAVLRRRRRFLRTKYRIEVLDRRHRRSWPWVGQAAPISPSSSADTACNQLPRIGAALHRVPGAAWSGGAVVL